MWGGVCPGRAASGGVQDIQGEEDCPHYQLCPLLPTPRAVPGGPGLESPPGHKEQGEERHRGEPDGSLGGEVDRQWC